MGVGVGVGVGAGTLRAGLVACALPPGFVAVTRQAIACPASASVSV